MSAGGNPNNISLGAGRLWVAAIGTAEPTSGSALLPSADWRAVGYTEDGTTVTFTLNNEEIEVAEEFDPVLYVNNKRTTMLKVQLAEATRRNLSLVLGGLATAGTLGAYEPPNPGDEVAFMAVWDSEDSAQGNADNIRWLFRSCKSGGTIETQRNKAPNKALLPIEVNVQKPVDLAPFKVWPNSSGLI